MIPINSVLALFIFIVGLTLTTSIIISIRAHIMYERCLHILDTAFEWLKECKDNKEVKHEHHQG